MIKKFAPDQVEEAIDFLSDIMKQGTMIFRTPETVSEDQLKEINKSLYGVNAPTIANYISSQLLFADNIDRICNLMRLRKCNCTFISCTPISFTAFNRIRMDNIEYAMDYFNPEEYWGDSLEYHNDAISNNLNPIITVQHTYVVFNKSDNWPLIEAITGKKREFFGDKERVSVGFELLPCNNPERIEGFINSVLSNI